MFRERKKRKEEKRETKQITDLQWGKKFVFPPRLPMIHTFVQELLISPNKFDAIKKTRDKTERRTEKKE